MSGSVIFFLRTSHIVTSIVRTSPPSSGDSKALLDGDFFTKKLGSEGEGKMFVIHHFIILVPIRMWLHETLQIPVPRCCGGCCCSRLDYIHRRASGDHYSSPDEICVAVKCVNTRVCSHGQAVSVLIQSLGVGWWEKFFFQPMPWKPWELLFATSQPMWLLGQSSARSVPDQRCTGTGEGSPWLWDLGWGTRDVSSWHRGCQGLHTNFNCCGWHLCRVRNASSACSILGACSFSACILFLSSVSRMKNF